MPRRSLLPNPAALIRALSRKQLFLQNNKTPSSAWWAQAERDICNEIGCQRWQRSHITASAFGLSIQAKWEITRHLHSEYLQFAVTVPFAVLLRCFTFSRGWRYFVGWQVILLWDRTSGKTSVKTCVHQKGNAKLRLFWAGNLGERKEQMHVLDVVKVS